MKKETPSEMMKSALTTTPDEERLRRDLEATYALAEKAFDALLNKKRIEEIDLNRLIKIKPHRGEHIMNEEQNTNPKNDSIEVK